MLSLYDSSYQLIPKPQLQQRKEGKKKSLFTFYCKRDLKLSVYLCITEQHVTTLWPQLSSSFPPLPTAVNASWDWLSTTKPAQEARAVTLHSEKYFTSKFCVKLNHRAV